MNLCLCSSRSDPALMQRLHNARDVALGDKDKRGEAKYLPVETKVGDEPIGCATKERTRCYSLGVSYEKPPTLCAPNANLKLPFDEEPTEFNSIRKELMEVRFRFVWCDCY